MAYRILWCSIHSIHDTSNDALIYSRNMLLSLVQRGASVVAINAFTSEDGRGLENLEHVDQMADREEDILRMTDNGIELFVVHTCGHRYYDLTLREMDVIKSGFLGLLDEFQPDMVMGYGHDEFMNSIYREAKARGIATVNDLHNGVCKGHSFIDCDLVFTFSEAVASMYRDAGIDVKAVGPFIDKEQVFAPDREKIDHVKYVTLVNPVPEKGLAIYIKLQEVFSRKHPEVQFLVVEANGKFPNVLGYLHNKDGSPYEPIAAGDIKFIEHLDDLKLMYYTAQVIVMPSLECEVWGHAATGAVINGIPVLASKKGGLPEAVGDGGVLLDAPVCTQNDFCCVPDDEDIAPWVEALERCINDDWAAACSKASESFAIERSTDRLMEYLEPLLKKGQQHERMLEHSTVFCDKALQKRKRRYPDLTPKKSVIGKVSGFVSKMFRTKK